MKAVWTIDNNLPALQEEIPSWVPPSVVTIALGGHLRWEPRRFNCRGEEQPIDPIGRRLLIDPRMERVWGELKKHIPNEPYITKVNQECYASDLNNSDAKPPAMLERLTAVQRFRE
jgi:hypothetical protein